MIKRLQIEMNADEHEFFSTPAFAMLDKQSSRNLNENRVKVKASGEIELFTMPRKETALALQEDAPAMVLDAVEKFVLNSIRDSSPCKNCSAMMLEETSDFKVDVIKKPIDDTMTVKISGLTLGCGQACDDSWIDSAAWTIQRDLHHKKGARVDSRRELEDYLKHRIKLVDEEVEAELEKRNPPFTSGAYHHAAIMPAVMNMDNTAEMLKSKALMDLKQEVITGRMYERYEAHRNKVTKVEKKSGIPKTQADVIW